MDIKKTVPINNLASNGEKVELAIVIIILQGCMVKLKHLNSILNDDICPNSYIKERNLNAYKS